MYVWVHLKPKYEDSVGQKHGHSCWFSVAGEFLLFFFASQWMALPNSAWAAGKSQSVLFCQKHFLLWTEDSVAATGSKGGERKMLMLAHALHLHFRPSRQMDLSTAWRESSEIQANPAPSMYHPLHTRSIRGSGSRQLVIRVKDKRAAHQKKCWEECREGLSKLYGGDYFQRPPPPNNSLLYQVVLLYTPMYAHTHIHLGPEMLCTSLILPEYLDTYQSHLFFPQFLASLPILMAVSLPIKQPSSSAFWFSLDEEVFMHLKKSLGDLVKPWMPYWISSEKRSCRWWTNIRDVVWNEAINIPLMCVLGCAIWHTSPPFFLPRFFFLFFFFTVFL